MNHKSDDILRGFLCGSNEDILSTLIELMDTVWSLKRKRLKRFHVPDAIPPAGTPERIQLVDETVKHLKYFGSESISYGVRRIIKSKPGVSYLAMLRDVCRLLNKILRPPFDIPVLGKTLLWFGIGGKKSFSIPRIATVEDYESLIVEMLVTKHLQSKSQSELTVALQEAGLDLDAAVEAALQIAKTGMSGGLLLFLVKLLGKKAIKDITLNIIVAYVEKEIGKEAAKKLAQSIAKKTTQKAFSKLASGIGWVLLAYDAVSLASPASRITVPTIVYLSAMRYTSRNE